MFLETILGVSFLSLNESALQRFSPHKLTRIKEREVRSRLSVLYMTLYCFPSMHVFRTNRKNRIVVCVFMYSALHILFVCPSLLSNSIRLMSLSYMIDSVSSLYLGNVVILYSKSPMMPVPNSLPRELFDVLNPYHVPYSIKGCNQLLLQPLSHVEWGRSCIDVAVGYIVTSSESNHQLWSTLL